MVSVVVIVYDASEASVIAPPEGALKVIAFRVVTADGADAPAEPGSPVCSFTNPDTAV
jgi:hypothetical protein